MSKVTVTVFVAPLSQSTKQVTFDNAELHMSTNGVLVVRHEDSRKVLAAYNASVWTTAEIAN